MNTAIIAEVLGVFFGVVGISMIINSRGTATAIEESIHHKGILWLWGFLAALTGATIVGLNNVWTSGLPLLVTILGWIALLKGALILFFPNLATSLYKRFNKSEALIFCGVIVFILGLVLLYW